MARRHSTHCCLPWSTVLKRATREQQSKQSGSQHWPSVAAAATSSIRFLLKNEQPEAASTYFEQLRAVGLADGGHYDALKRDNILAWQ
eukprot:SAG31_NODE_2481_length_5630_cov_2.585005_1_plen_87_part_10